MSIRIEIPDNFFQDIEKDNLSNLFGTIDESEFEKKLTGLIHAALEEYKDMCLGMGLPYRANEIREFRLFYLIKYFFDGKIPNELEVSRIFQLPESRSKNLIQNVLTRFHFDLKKEINTKLAEIFSNENRNFNKKENEIYIFIDSLNMVDIINRMIVTEDFRLKKISKIRGETNQYMISIDSFNVIKKQLGIE